ncbi:hypothetical protein SRHO_G00257030 [Serrasalmus rhombeus]
MGNPHLLKYQSDQSTRIIMTIHTRRHCRIKTLKSTGFIKQFKASPQSELSPAEWTELSVLVLFESLVPSVKVKLHDSATLSCSERCSGLVKWTEFSKPTDPLAECDQTSCRSVKEGYQMIHDQYLKGNLSLIITDADFTKRARYISDCDGKDVCDVRLQIEPLRTSVQITPGDSLVLDLDIPEEVEVIYDSTGAAGPSTGQICTVDGRSLQCKPEYKQRTSAALQLRGGTPSDTGVYIVMDKKNEEVIHIYTVTVGSARGSDKMKGMCYHMISVYPIRIH